MSRSRDVHRGIEGQRDVDVLAVVVGAAVARRRHDLGPVGAERSGAPAYADPQSPVSPLPILARAPKQQFILKGPSGFVAAILGVAVGGADLRPVVIRAAGDAVEHEPVVGVRQQEGVGRGAPLIVCVVVQLTSGEGSDLGAQPRAAVQVGVDCHVAALVRVAHVQPDTVQLIAAGIGSGPESLHQPVLVPGQTAADVGAGRLVHVLYQRGDRRVVLLRGRGRAGGQRGDGGNQHRRSARGAASRARQPPNGADGAGSADECDYGCHRYHDLPRLIRTRGGARGRSNSVG